MNTTSANVMAKAQEALQYFEVRSPHPEKGVDRKVVLRIETPPWVVDLCREAHEGMLPNDVIFEMIYDQLQVIAANELGIHLEAADEQPNFVLLRWFNECFPLSAEYVKEARECCEPGSDIMDELRSGYALHSHRLAEILVSQLGGDLASLQEA